jgi:hypothetical protein
MISVDTFSGILSVLSECGTIPASRIGRPSLDRLRPLLEGGVIEKKKRGAGGVYEVLNNTAFTVFCEKEYPSGLHGEKIEEGLNGKAFAVAAFRDAHRGTTSPHNPVLIRGFGDAQLVSRDGDSLPVANLTKVASVTAINADGAACKWGIAGRVALVENIEFFFRAEELVDNLDFVLWNSGRVANKTIEWLAAKSEGLELIHCGDYDPVGLSEYLKLKDACPHIQVSLFLPENLDALFVYGKKKRLSDQSACVKGLRNSKDPAVRFVLSLCDKHNRGLDQEALLCAIS